MASPLAVQVAPFGPEQLWRVLDQVIPAQMQRDHLPGAAVAAVWNGEIVFCEGYGAARLEPETPVSPETTLFRIGSISKACTVLALARELERAKLRPEDEIAPHLEGLALAGRFTEPLRFWHLMTHTAGFDQIGLDRHASGPADQLDPRGFLAGRLMRVRPPGQVTCYDTYAITLAGHLVERLARKPFAQALREGLFEPLGMERTFVQAPEALRGDLALGYGYEGGKHVPQRYEWYNTQPASAIDSTALDMARLLVALLGDGANEEGRILAPETVARLRRPQFRNDPGLPGFTYGFWEEFHGGERALQHGGTMLGFSARLTLFPERGLGLFSACNRDGETGPPPAFHDALVRTLTTSLDLADPAPSEARPAEVDLAPFVGSYTHNIYCHTCAPGAGWGWSPFEVRAAGEGELEFWGRRWRAVGPREFHDGAERAVFRVDSRGRVTHLFSGNLTSERIGETLLEEVVGPDWREHPEHPLVARVKDYRPPAAPAALPPVLDLALPPELLARWAGRYRFDSGFELELAARDGRLWLVIEGRVDRRVLYQGAEECRVEGEAALRIVFRGSGERSEGFTFHDDDGTAHEVARVE